MGTHLVENMLSHQVQLFLKCSSGIFYICPKSPSDQDEQRNHRKVKLSGPLGGHLIQHPA